MSATSAANGRRVRRHFHVFVPRFVSPTVSCETNTHVQVWRTFPCPCALSVSSCSLASSTESPFMVGCLCVQAVTRTYRHRLWSASTCNELNLLKNSSTSPLLRVDSTLTQPTRSTRDSAAEILEVQLEPPPELEFGTQAKQPVSVLTTTGRTARSSSNGRQKPTEKRHT